MSDYHPMTNAPHDRPVLVYFDHDADPYNDPADPMRLTDYAANADGGNFLGGRGVTIAHWADSYEESDGWEAGNSYTMPAGWFAWLDGDMTDHAVNALLWAEIPQPLASLVASVGTHPEGGDAKQAPCASMGDAVPATQGDAK